MNFDKIRNMSDEELSKLFKQLSSRGSKSCIKCDKPSTFIIKVENTKVYQTKKLCGLCEKCYQELLSGLDVFDIDWHNN